MLWELILGISLVLSSWMIHSKELQETKIQEITHIKKRHAHLVSLHKKGSISLLMTFLLFALSALFLWEAQREVKLTQNFETKLNAYLCFQELINFHYGYSTKMTSYNRKISHAYRIRIAALALIAKNPMAFRMADRAWKALIHYQNLFHFSKIVNLKQMNQRVCPNHQLMINRLKLPFGLALKRMKNGGALLKTKKWAMVLRKPKFVLKASFQLKHGNARRPKLITKEDQSLLRFLSR